MDRKGEIVYDKFVVVDKYEGTSVSGGSNGPRGNVYEVYDVDTYVMYYLFESAQAQGLSQGLCPIYNSDGTIKVYQER